MNQIEGRLTKIEGLINDLADHEPAPEPGSPDEDDDAKSEAPTEEADDGADADDEGDETRPPRPPETTQSRPSRPRSSARRAPPAVPPDDDVNLPVAAGMARDLHAAVGRRAAASTKGAALGLVRCDLSP